MPTPPAPPLAFFAPYRPPRPLLFIPPFHARPIPDPLLSFARPSHVPWRMYRVCVCVCVCCVADAFFRRAVCARAHVLACVCSQPPIYVQPTYTSFVAPFFSPHFILRIVRPFFFSFVIVGNRTPPHHKKGTAGRRGGAGGGTFCPLPPSPPPPGKRITKVEKPASREERRAGREGESRPGGEGGSERARERSRGVVLTLPLRARVFSPHPPPHNPTHPL